MTSTQDPLPQPAPPNTAPEDVQPEEILLEEMLEESDEYAPEINGVPVWDEALYSDGTPRPNYAPALETIAEIGAEDIQQRQDRGRELAAELGMTFRVLGEEKPQIFPMDSMPRIIDAGTWEYLSRGLEQRARALNAFLDDVYGERRIVAAGIVNERDLERAPGLQEVGKLQPSGDVRAHICGMDLICTDEGRWFVLEDNLRVPSGIAFADSMRTIQRELYPEVIEQYSIHEPTEVFDMLKETISQAAPLNATDPTSPSLAVISGGPGDSAWYEHSLIAERLGAPILLREDVAVIDGRMSYRNENGEIIPIDVVYSRIDQDLLWQATGFNGEPLGPGIEDALARRRLAFANAFGNGVGDDKSIYAYVPEMIRFYLDEEPLLPQVQTWLCYREEDQKLVRERVADLVVKPVDGYGGQGITIGPECSEQELEQRRQELDETPEQFIAQEVVRLSTLPTYRRDEAGTYRLSPRHVDLRAFVHVRALPEAREAVAAALERGDSPAPINAAHISAHTVPAGLTRTAPEGSLIVNSSRGGGGKDTWILRDTIAWDEQITVQDFDDGPEGSSTEADSTDA